MFRSINQMNTLCFPIYWWCFHWLGGFTTYNTHKREVLCWRSWMWWPCGIMKWNTFQRSRHSTWNGYKSLNTTELETALNILNPERLLYRIQQQNCSNSTTAENCCNAENCCKHALLCYWLWLWACQERIRIPWWQLNGLVNGSESHNVPEVYDVGETTHHWVLGVHTL